MFLKPFHETTAVRRNSEARKKEQQSVIGMAVDFVRITRERSPQVMPSVHHASTAGRASALPKCCVYNYQRRERLSAMCIDVIL